jgi:hypothetical protein
MELPFFRKKAPVASVAPAAAPRFALVQHAPIDIQGRRGDLRGTAPLFFGYLVGLLYLAILFMVGNILYSYWSLESRSRYVLARQTQSAAWNKQIKALNEEYTRSESMKTLFESQQKWLKTVYPSNEIYRRLFAAVPADKFTITALEMKVSDIQPTDPDTLRLDVTVQFQSSGEDTASISRFLQNCNRAHLTLENVNNRTLPDDVTSLSASILVTLPLMPEDALK